MPLAEGIPVFIISFNRAEMLRRCVAGVRRQTAVSDIIVHDNGSDDPAALAELASLEESGVRVVRRAKIHDVAELDNVAETVADYLAGEEREYVVTDSDIDLGEANENSVALYSWLLANHLEVECVGPMLTIADIPETYPLRERALRGHIDQFWHRIPAVQDTPFGLVASIPAPIDTTFAVHRAGTAFRRLRPGLRVYAPFEARHLDWHITLADFRPHGKPNPIAHWGNEDWREEESHVRAGGSPYFTVSRPTPLALVIRKRHATDPPAGDSAPADPEVAQLRDYDEARARLEQEFGERLAQAQEAAARSEERAEQSRILLDRQLGLLDRSRRRTRTLAAVVAVLLLANSGLLLRDLVG